MNGNCEALQERLNDLRQQLEYQELRRSICEESRHSRDPAEAAAAERCLDDVGRRINDILPRMRRAERELELCLEERGRRELVITIVGIEQTQAIQFFRPPLQPCPDRQSAGPCPDNDIKLIAGKTIVLRVYVDVAIGGTPMVSTLSGVLETRQVGRGTWDPPLTPYNAPTMARRIADVDRGIASHTLNFRIPAERCRGNLEVRLTVFDAAHPQEAGYTSAPLTRTLRFLRAAPLRIRLVRIRYRNEARNLDISAPTVDDFWTTAEFTLRTYPISNIILEAESEELYDGDFTGLFDAPSGAIGTTGSVFTIIDNLQKAEGRVGDARVKYFALIPGAPGNQSGALGWGVAPNRAVGEVFNGPVMAQEIAHTCGRGHAPCGVPDPDPNYPAYDNYPSGSIGEFGFDVVDSAVYDPANTFDFMSYCLNNAWVSPYTYEALMNCFPTFSVAGEIVRERRELLYLSFTIYRDGVVTMRGAGFHLKGYLEAPSGQSTPYFVELHDENGLILDAQRLRLNDVHRSLDDASLDFLAAIPWRTQASKVVFKREEQVLHSVEIGKVVPEVEITSPKGGGILTGKQKIAWSVRSSEGEFTYILRYSHDGGQSWRAVATGLMSNEFIVDVDGLPGGAKCVFQVLASAGIRTGAATSAPFSVPRKPLKPSITRPHNGDTFVQGDSVFLFGVASSPGGGSAEAEMLNWSSSINDFLGSGSQLIVHTLSVGRHCITLRTDDNCGGEASTSIYLTVKPRESR